MTMFAGSDVNFKRTAAKAIAAALHRWARSLAEVGLESGAILPGWLESLVDWAFLCMDSWRAADDVTKTNERS
jgi:hypothetical protein